MLSKLRRAFRAVFGVFGLQRELEAVRTDFVRAQLSTESLLVDLMLRSDAERKSLPVANAQIELITEYPIAISSNDHLFPRGTASDVTRAPAFVRYCKRLMGESSTYLDLGCSGGGVVLDFVLQGQLSIGLEGSDYSKRSSRAAWRIIPSNLFTCDICSPFILRSRASGEPFKFDVVGAWEVLEHIPEQVLPGLLANIAKHMHSQSVFMGSIATFPDEDRENKVVWHVTIRSREWWMQQFLKAGLEPADVTYDSLDMPRGSGNGPYDWSAIRNPNLGFHVVLKRVGCPGPPAVATKSVIK